MLRGFLRKLFGQDGNLMESSNRSEQVRSMLIRMLMEFVRSEVRRKGSGKRRRAWRNITEFNLEDRWVCDYRPGFWTYARCMNHRHINSAFSLPISLLQLLSSVVLLSCSVLVHCSVYPSIYLVYLSPSLSTRISTPPTPHQVSIPLPPGSTT